jgi:hypothetical protein
VAVNSGETISPRNRTMTYVKLENNAISIVDYLIIAAGLTVDLIQSEDGYDLLANLLQYIHIYNQKINLSF